MSKFVGLRAKTDSYLIDEGSENKKRHKKFEIYKKEALPWE